MTTNDSIRRVALFAALGAVAAIAACSNGNDSSTGCSKTTASAPVLLYPAPNSTGITAGLQLVAVYNLGGALGYVQLTALPSEPTLTGAQFVLASPLPLPSPAASAPPRAVIYSSAITPPLISGATYTVQFKPNAQPPCGPQQVPTSIGSFTVAN
jgi:hypothetical protein